MPKIETIHILTIPLYGGRDFFLIQVQLGRETNTDLNTTANATKTELQVMEAL